MHQCKTCQWRSWIVEKIAYSHGISLVEPPTSVFVRFDYYVSIPLDEVLCQTIPSVYIERDTMRQHP